MKRISQVAICCRQRQTSDEHQAEALPMTENQEPCLVCGLQADFSRSSGDRYSFTCKRCGRYDVTGSIYGPRHGSPPDMALSGVLRNHHETSPRVLVIITFENYEVLKSSAPAKTDVPSKVRYLLRYIARHSARPGTMVGFDGNTDCSVCFAADADELDYYFLYAKEVGYITGDREGTKYHGKLTPPGWEEVTRVPTSDSPNAFVAMSFSSRPILRQAYEVAIKPAIETDAGYHAIRVDQKDFLGDIVFEIIARIKESRFIVADVTEHKNGVYFEGGFAMGMQLPVIWMCYQPDMGKTHLVATASARYRILRSLCSITNNGFYCW